MGNMQDVALDMLNHFKNGSGTNYSNPLLTAKVAQDETFQNWANTVIDDYLTAIKNNNGLLSTTTSTPAAIKLADPNGSLNQMLNCAGGLGITLDAITETNILLTNLRFNYTTNKYEGTMKFVLKDEFGLDADDILVNGERDIPPGAGEAFRAWFILQHYRCGGASTINAKPFTTQLELTINFNRE